MITPQLVDYVSLEMHSKFRVKIDGVKDYFAVRFDEDHVSFIAKSTSKVIVEYSREKARSKIRVTLKGIVLMVPDGKRVSITLEWSGTGSRDLKIAQLKHWLRDRGQQDWSKVVRSANSRVFRPTQWTVPLILLAFLALPLGFVYANFDPPDLGEVELVIDWKATLVNGAFVNEVVLGLFAFAYIGVVAKKSWALTVGTIACGIMLGVTGGRFLSTYHTGTFVALCWKFALFVSFATASYRYLKLKRAINIIER